MFQKILHLFANPATELEGDALLQACIQAINVIYVMMLVFALPAAIYQHLVLDFKPAALVFCISAIIYFPVLLGWFPKSLRHRLSLALVSARLRHIASTTWGTRRYMSMDWLNEHDMEAQRIA